MKHYIWIAAVLVLVTLLLLPSPSERDAPDQQRRELPWQIDKLPSGATLVFGLIPGQSTFSDALARFGPRVEAALFQAPDGTLTAEAYYSSVGLSGLTGKLILTLELDAPSLAELKANSSGRKPLRTGNVSYEIAGQDANTIQGASIRGITFIPTANLDAETVRARFGPPAEQVVIDENIVHWLYPDLGLHVTINQRGKDLLLYVHPGDFDWVRAGLD